MTRRKHYRGKVSMFIVLIVAMNLIGITYGQWQEGLSSDLQVGTGYIKPYFSDKAEVKKAREFNRLKTSLKADAKNESKYVKLTGEIETGKKGKFTLDYTVDNNGSLPIKFDDVAFTELNSKLMKNKKGGLKILKNEPESKVLYPVDYKVSGRAGKGSLTLQIDTAQEVGEYEFEIEIPYKLWTGN